MARPDMTTARPGVANAIRTQMPRQRVPPTAVSRATVGWCANAVSALGGDCDRRRPIVCEAIWARSRHGAWEVGKRVYNSRACRRCARRKEAEGEAAGQEAAHGRACRHQAGFQQVFAIARENVGGTGRLAGDADGAAPRVSLAVTSEQCRPRSVARKVRTFEYT